MSLIGARQSMVEEDTKTCMNLWIEVAAGVLASGAILDQHYAWSKRGGESGRWTVVYDFPRNPRHRFYLQCT